MSEIPLYTTHIWISIDVLEPDTADHDRRGADLTPKP